MSLRCTLTMANGKAMNLRFPTPGDYKDRAWVAEHLSKIKRYSGATPQVEYSVAQHVVLGTEYAMKLYADPLVAAYFSTHDDEEAPLGDDTTPKKNAYAEEAAEKLGVLAEDVLKVFGAVAERHNVALHIAAGLQWPPPAEVKAKIKYIDRVMLKTEWRDLMKGMPLPLEAEYRDVEILPQTIRPWRWGEACARLQAIWRVYLPVYHTSLTGK